MTDSALVAAPSMALSDESKRMLDGLIVVRETLAPDLSVGELQLFAMVASRSGLDPFARQIYAVKRKGRMTIQTGIDGYRSIAARTGEYDGQDEPLFSADCGCGKGSRHPESCTVAVYRKGVGRAIKATAYWHEYVPDAGQSGNGDVMWRKMPHVMIAKVAEALALRKAFPWDPSSGRGIGGDIYTAEEMEQADNRPPAVSVQERVAARIGVETTGVSLRYFADAVREMDPETIRTARADLFPDAAGVAELTHEQRATLLDKLLRPDASVALESPEPDEIEGVAVDATPEPPAEPTPETPPDAGKCGAPSPFTEGATCIQPEGHRAFHRSGPGEAWPVK